MCEYCEKVIGRGRKKTETEECELMKNFPIVDDFTEKEIQDNGENPVQYIRKYKGRYLLVTEFGNNDGDAILFRINYCPVCGRKLGSGMTENEAIKGLKTLFSEHELDLPCTDSLEILHITIKALEEIQQCRSIGTVEECRNAMERQIGKKPYLWGDGLDDEGELIYDMYDCPNCGKSYEIDYEEYKHCPECGQAIDWSEVN